MTHVLYVEESAILRETLSASLEINGLRATTCGDAPTAWRHLMDEGCDLLLLDIPLRKGTGLTLLQRVRANPRTRTIPVVLLTGCTNPETIRRAVAFKPHKLLVKSNFSLDRLLEVIREAQEAPPPALETIAEPPPDAPASAPPAAAIEAHAANVAESSPAAPAAAPATPTDDHAPAASPPPPAPARAEPSVTRTQLEQMEPLMSRRETVTTVSGTAPLAPSSAPVARAVRAALAASGTEHQLAGALAADASLAARVARVAAADRGDDDPVPEEPGALIGHLGADRVREALMLVCTLDRFAGVGEDLVPPGPFWGHVLGVARLARGLAESVDGVAPTAAFAAGLLHDLGRLVLAESARSVYAPLTSLATRAAAPLEEVETRMLGLSHADVVAELLDGWAFGGDLASVVRLHHGSRAELEQLDREHAPLAIVLALADRLAHAHLAGDPLHDRVAATEDLARALHLDASHADRAGDGLAAWTRTVAAAATDGRIVPETAAGVLRAALGDGAIRPLMLPHDAAGDACRVGIRRMLAASGRPAPPLTGEGAVVEGGPPPNVAVIRLRRGADVRGEIARLQELEPAAGHGPLPVLVLADDAAAANAEALAGRRVEVLELPVRALEIAERLAELALPEDAAGEGDGNAARTAA